MSVQLQRRTLNELLHEGRYLYPTNVVDVIERFHGTEGPGVPREVIGAYVTEVLSRLGPRAPYTSERFLQLLDRRVADLETWMPDALYEVSPGRISVYPPTWHQELTGVQDPAQYVHVISEDLAATRGATVGGPMPPVPEATLIDAMMVLGGLERSTASGYVKQARLSGRLIVEPYQNPRANVWIPRTDQRSRQPSTAASPGQENTTRTERRHGNP